MPPGLSADASPHAGATWTVPPLVRTMALGLAITCCQSVLALAASGQTSLPGGLASLAALDGGWFCTVVDDGYVWDVKRLSEEHYQSNVCFFPAFPLAARALRRVSGLPTPVAVTLTAQLACWGFWTYLLLLLRRWGVSPGHVLAAILAVALYPTAFFLVAGYSEALFLTGLVGMIYWSRRGGPAAWSLTALHGLVMCASRFVGVALVLYPLLQSWLERPRAASTWAWLRAAWPRLALTATASLGVVGYFAYCHFHFGRWDLYLFASQVGWLTSADYLGALRPGAYWPGWPLKPEGFSADRLSSWFPALLLLLGGWLAAAEWRRRTFGDRPWRRRAGLYGVACLLFYLTVAAKVQVRMSSLTRLSLPVYVLLVLAAAHLLRTGEIRRKGLTTVALVSLGLASLALQVYLTYRFTHGLWVA